MKQHSMIAGEDLENMFALYHDRKITCRAFLNDVEKVCGQLPASNHLINLYQDPYLFIVVFAACLRKKIISLFPNHTSPGILQQTVKEYPGCTILDEKSVSLETGTMGKRAVIDNFQVDAAQEACIFFTSGSNGQPRPYGKTWGELVVKSHDMRDLLALDNDKPELISTVPNQHLFGFEHFIMLGLQSHAVLILEKAFFPQDLASLAAKTTAQKLVISTPCHLNFFLRSECQFINVSTVLSSTAPLDRLAAAGIEKRFNCRLVEIYGCTELGAVATRNTSLENQWYLLPGLQIGHNDDDHSIFNRYTQKSSELPDLIQPAGAETFYFLQRRQDNLNIAGKRISAADLNIKINSIDGIEDGYCYLPAYLDGMERIVAFVVTALPEENIRRELGKIIDPLFIPKHIVKLEKLPRDNLGKISRRTLDSLTVNHLNPDFEFVINRTHPALAGHFPGNPIVPGAVIMDNIIECYRKIDPDFRLSEILHVKFRQKLLPDHSVCVMFNIRDHEIHFRAHAGQHLITTGIFN